MAEHDEAVTERQGSSWRELVNRARREEDAKQDFASVVEMRRRVEEVQNEAPPRLPVDPRHETVGAIWNATTNLLSEATLTVKDLSRTVLPLDSAYAGIKSMSEGKGFFEGVAEQDVANAEFNEDLRRSTDDIQIELKSTTAQLAEPMLQFMVPYLGAMKVARAGQAVTAATFAESSAMGFLVDSGLFDPTQGNLSSLINSLPGDYSNVVTEYLATDPNDSEADNRLRLGLEGLILGTALEGIFRAARHAIHLKQARQTVVDADLDTIKLDDIQPTRTADEVELDVDVEAPTTPATSGADLANPGKFFSDDAMERAYTATRGDAKAMTVEMTAREYLDAAKGLGEPVARKTENLKNVREAGEQIDQVPALNVEFEDGVLNVTGHEGRHRALRMIDEGLGDEPMTVTVHSRDQDLGVLYERNGEITFGYGADAPQVRPERFAQQDGGAGSVPFRQRVTSKAADPVDEALDAARQADEAATREATPRDLDLRSKIDMTPEQVVAYKKALASGNPEEMDKVLKDFNDETIDWSKIENPEDIHQILRVTSEIFEENIDEIKGGVQSHRETVRLANLVGATGEEVHKLFNDLRGGVGVTARVHAAERIMLASAKKLYALRESIKADPGNTNLKAEFYRHMQLHAALQAEVKGAKTEIARALNAMKILKDDADEGFTEFNDILRQFSGPKTDSVGFERFMDDLLDGRDLAELNAKIRQTAGQRYKNMFIEYTINAMLSSLKTHAINFTSNTLNTFLYSFDRFAGGSYRWLRGDPRLLREARLDLYHKFASLDEAWKLARQAWRDGAPVTDKRQRLEFNTRKAIRWDGNGWLEKTGNVLGTVIRVPGRALITGDEFFKAINRNAELQVLGFRKADEEAAERGLAYGSREYERYVTARTQQLIDPNTSSRTARQIRSEAVEKSRRVTFQEAPRTQGGQRMEAMINSNAFVKLVIAPFFRTPMNILRQGLIDRTPLGAFIPEARQMILKGTPNQRAEAIARMTTGVAAITGFSTIMMNKDEESNFEIIGKVPFESSRKVDGVLDYSIRIGDKWYQYNRLDPLGMFIGMAADMAYSVKHHDETDPNAGSITTAYFQGMMGAVWNNAANKTWMKSASDLFEMLESWNSAKPATMERQWAKFASNQIGKLVPQLYKSSATAIEGERDAKEAWTVLDGLAAQMPFMGADVPDRHDVLGRKMTREMSAWSVINPFATSPDSDDPVEQEFAKLAFDIRPMPRSFAGGKVQLTAQEYSKLTGLVAEFDLEGRLRERITDPSWNDKTDERKVYEIKKLVEAIRKAARGRFLADPEIRAKYKEMVALEHAGLLE